MKTPPLKLGPNQEKWLRALESGRYKRGRSWLKMERGGKFEYCCLGVACEVAGVKWQLGYGGRYSTSGCDASLPESMVRWLGVFSHIGVVGYWEIDEPSMAEMNDSLDLSFKKIAARIRKRPGAYFKEPM